MKSLVVVLLTALVLSSEAIINGQNWLIAPYMARFQLSGGQQGAGTIISQRHILTSGFVLSTSIFPQLSVFVGGITRNTQTMVAVQRRIQHPLYQDSPRLNDIGIIELTMQITFNRFIQPIALPSFSDSLPWENEQGTALGFGGFPAQTNQDLQAAFMRVTTPTRCSLRHPQHSLEQQFCAEDEPLRSDICVGDIGGPFITLLRGEEILVGLASNAICQVNINQPVQPSLFTRVSAYRTWINQQTQA